MGWMTRIRERHQAPSAANGSAPAGTAARTDRGRTRSANQDAAFVQELPGGTLVAVVADGVGGARGGETASSEAVRILAGQLVAESSGHPASDLVVAFDAANRSIRRLAAERPELEGMATTLVAAVIHDGSLWAANAGDSRAYLFRNGLICRLTEDHSWVAEQVRAGRLTGEEAAASPLRNVITRAIGMGDTIEPDIFGPEALAEGDAVLLCTDGLYRVVTDEEIAAVLAELPPSQAATRLIDMANAAGGPDNIGIAILAANS